MKDLIISLILFSLVLTGVGLNAAYVRNVSAQLIDFAEALSASSDPEDTVSTLTDYWEHAKGYLIWTVEHQELRQISEAVLSLQAAYRCDDSAAFERYRSLLAELGAELAHAESIPLLNVPFP
ncbi:MAG: DUF4363 family protein [Clostridia bacterium]|nr:DUF4363 family protein [Clostridia bacterium]